jgi:hypothetical protein
MVTSIPVQVLFTEDVESNQHRRGSYWDVFLAYA